MKRLPIGISTLAKMRDENHVYIDKTRFVQELYSGYYFLSRPRRFGKSLFLDTLKQAFLGNKEVFRGLYLENNWDWSKKHPVIHFDLGMGVLQSREALESGLNYQLDVNYRTYEMPSRYDDAGERFSDLIVQLYEKYKEQVVILIDEYDKPILDNIDNREAAIANREGLKNFYSVIKAHDSKLRLVFLTGVSKFSKVSLFSGLNNLRDITLNAKTSDICGYTQAELENSFAEHLADGNVDLERMKLWYNGYNFGGNSLQKVYNPFDVLLFLANDYQYRSYWFETATPTFLIKMLSAKRQNLFEIERMEVTEDILSSFDIDDMPLETLMWQTGYLTILDVLDEGDCFAYAIGYPNLEVKTSINRQLARIGTTVSESSRNYSALSRAIAAGDMEKLCQTMTAMFACIPHQWYINNPISEYEGFYATVVYSYLSALGYITTAEDATSVGSIDISVESKNNIIIFELKLSKYGTAKEVLKQIEDKKYAEKFMANSKPVYLLGVSFDSVSRNVKGNCPKFRGNRSSGYR